VSYWNCGSTITAVTEASPRRGVNLFIISAIHLVSGVPQLGYAATAAGRPFATFWYYKSRAARNDNLRLWALGLHRNRDCYVKSRSKGRGYVPQNVATFAETVLARFAASSAFRFPILPIDWLKHCKSRPGLLFFT
jgi:hypothetical protein